MTMLIMRNETIEDENYEEAIEDDDLEKAVHMLHVQDSPSTCLARCLCSSSGPFSLVKQQSGVSSKQTFGI